MTTEHRSVMAQMARLQGTIDERKRNLMGSSAPSAAILNHTDLSSQPIIPTTSSSIPPTSSTLTLTTASIPSSSSSSSSSSSFLNPSTTYVRTRPIQPQQAHHNLPVINKTKTTWQLVPSASTRQPSSIVSTFRPPTRRSTKLILNHPNRPILQPNPAAIPSSLPQPPTATTITSTSTTSTTSTSSSTPTLPLSSNLSSSTPLTSSTLTTQPINLLPSSSPNSLPAQSSSTVPSISIVVDHDSKASPDQIPQPPQSSIITTPSTSAIVHSSSLSPSAPSELTLSIPSNPTPQISNPSIVKQTTTHLSNLHLSPNTNPSLPLVRSSTPSQSNELVINGVSFVRDTQGKKLVRKTNSAPSNQIDKAPAVHPASLTTSQASKATPLKASVGGTTYIRTKSGNLVELSALKKFQSQKLQEIKKARLLAAVNAMRSKYNPNRSYPTSWDPKKLINTSRLTKSNQISRPPLIKKNEQCRFFAKTGACRNGLTCVYQHDPLQVAICPRFLRHKCPHSANSCPLSHKPNPHNMEHCSHFPRCNKSDCPYPHVKPTNNQICRDFAELGWCSKGSNCTDRHVRECPEFSTKGTCSNSNCRLRHMINRNKNDSPEDDDHKEAVEDHPTEEDSDHGTGGGLFFTDVTGTTNDLHNGKRKAPQRSQNFDHPHHQRSYKGISHNSEVNKRFKYDAMAGNEDFVMFISSDEEQIEGSDGTDSDEEEEQDGELDPSSVDSEELDDVLLEEGEEVCSTTAKSAIINSEESSSSGAPIVVCRPKEGEAMLVGTENSSIQPRWNDDDHQIVKPRNRSSLEPGEEIEDGEIFDDDDDEMNDGDNDGVVDNLDEMIDDLDGNRDALVIDDLPGSSSDDDELIARQLLGNRSSYRSITP